LDAQTLIGNGSVRRRQIRSNAEYIVVKRHPKLDASATKFERSVIEYFIVKRAPNVNANDPAAGVQGPLTEAQFRDMAGHMSLPPFSKVFDDLK
jgi:hypothetical protein